MAWHHLPRQGQETKKPGDDWPVSVVAAVVITRGMEAAGSYDPDLDQIKGIVRAEPGGVTSRP